MTMTHEQVGKHRRREEYMSGNFGDQVFRDKLNRVAVLEQRVPINRLPFTQNRDGMGILSVIIEELELTPGHFYIANDSEAEGWVAVVKFDVNEDELQAVIGSGATAQEAIEAVEKKLKDIYS